MESKIRLAGGVVGYASAVLQATAFVWYVWITLEGSVTTNPISWWLWSVETGVGLAIYADRTRDPSKWITEAVAMVGVTVVSLYLIGKMLMGKSDVVLASVESIDIALAIGAVLTFLLWLKIRHKVGGAGIALWAFQLVLVTAVIPLVRSTYANPAAEPLGPWVLWTVCFLLQALCAWWRWDGVEPLLNPINYALTHGIVAVIVWQGATS